MLKQIETKPRDAEAVLLARVYALILSFDEPRASNDEQKTRVNTQRAKSEVKNDEK